MFRQRLFAKRVKRSATLRITLNFSATSDEGKRIYNVEGCTCKKSFFSITAMHSSPFPFWLEFDSRPSEWRSRGILAATRCSRMQSRKSPLIETMSKEGNDNAVLLSLLPLFVFFSPPAVPLLRGGAHRSRLAGEKRKEFVARHRGEQYSVSVA